MADDALLVPGRQDLDDPEQVSERLPLAVGKDEPDPVITRQVVAWPDGYRQDPSMRRCVWTVTPFSTRVSRCFPRETVPVTARPVRSVVANRGTRKSLRVSTRPVSASSSWRAVRQTTSPSGMR